LADEFGHPEQGVHSAIEDDQQAHYFQLVQLDLPQRAILLKPAETLLDHPRTAIRCKSQQGDAKNIPVPRQDIDLLLNQTDACGSSLAV
jgi:hypothetical protein